MPRETQFILSGAEFSYPGSSGKVLSGIDLEIRAGEWVALLGSNGSGKTTLLKILSALLVPTQGSSFILGLPPDDGAAERKAPCAMVFQNPEDQIVASTLEEEIAFGPENLGCTAEEIRSRVTHSLEACGLSGMEKQLVSSLSGGQKQRLALAGALAMHPSAILLDEALSMLDPLSRREFTEVIAAEHAKGKTIVQVTHRLEEIRFAERMLLLKDGKIAFDMPREDFFRMKCEELSEFGLELPPFERLCGILRTEGLLPDGCAPDICAAEKYLYDAFC
ncbi:MAG: ATP-binding cassette domain-containing protein [Synergistes sp.]|nr:ATP-binding cassette domain-containing protein [Synergistes sp.]MCR5335270.1 ATP-binding cassette domain-containing protein [Synergistes sp.]